MSRCVPGNSNSYPESTGARPEGFPAGRVLLRRENLGELDRPGINQPDEFLAIHLLDLLENIAVEGFLVPDRGLPGQVEDVVIGERPDQDFHPAIVV